ncbi:MAG: hypothetical protein F6K39_15780 [Okeania sp. SIO3B3]|nr:hypothetical protein [Okeania sp. SIO3B3]
MVAKLPGGQWPKPSKPERSPDLLFWAILNKEHSAECGLDDLNLSEMMFRNRLNYITLL